MSSATTYLLWLRAIAMAEEIRATYAAFAVVPQRGVMLFKAFLPIFVWSILWASVGSLCWSEAEGTLDVYFGTTARSLKTVLQIMTFDSWTSIVDAFITYEPSLYEQKVCSVEWGVAWVYSAFVVFGLVLMNVLTGAFVEALTTSAFFTSMDGTGALDGAAEKAPEASTTRDDKDARADGMADGELQRLQQQVAALEAQQRKANAALETIVALLQQRKAPLKVEVMKT